MRKFYNDSRIKYFIGDVCSYDSVKRAFEGVDFIFSVVALNHILTCEFSPMEAANTNIIGTENVLNAYIKMGVKK